MATARGKRPTLKEKPVTLAEKLRLNISDEIVRGLLAPGVALDEAELAERFNVSRTPVREAIRLLVASGLVQARPHRSAVVARPDGPQLIAMFEARQELEALCAAFSAQRMTEAEIKRLHKLNEALADIVAKGDPQAYFENNETFHDAILDGAHNPILSDLARATRARVAPFSRAQFRTQGRLERSYAEHKGIVDAIAMRDSAGAAQAMRDHIAIVREVYAATMRG